MKQHFVYNSGIFVSFVEEYRHTFGPHPRAFDGLQFGGTT
jgi:hypothetical protein